MARDYLTLDFLLDPDPQGLVEGTDAWYEAEEYFNPSNYIKGTDIWHEATAYQKKKASGAIAIDIQVSGVEALAKSFETLSARAHKALIPNVLTRSVNRLNREITKNIPVGPRGHEGDTGGWRKAQAQIYAEFIAAGERDATTYAVPLPTHEVLGLKEEAEQTVFYPWAVEFGTGEMAARAPIRSAVNAQGDREFRQMGRLLGKGFVGLARAHRGGQELTPRQLKAAEKLDVAIGPTPGQFAPQ